MKLISKFLLTLFVRATARGLNKDDIAAGVSCCVSAYCRQNADPLTEAKKYWDAVSKVAPRKIQWSAAD